MTKAQKQDRAEAIARLRDIIKPGDTIHCMLRGPVSRSGMSRTIQLVKFAPDDKGGVTEFWIGHNVATACGLTWDNKREGIRMGGCGMDMGFALVNDLSYALYGREAGGYACLGDNCPSADHSNASYHCTCGHDRNSHDNEGWQYKGCKEADCSCQSFTRHDPRGAGVIHMDGYALRHRWL